MQFCSSINRDHWRRIIIRNYVSPSTELKNSIDWIKGLHKSSWVLHQSIIVNLHMWFKELHNPTSFMGLNNWYLQPHGWFAEIHNWFVELLIYSFIILFKEIHNVLWLFMKLHKCDQYNIIDLWSPMIKLPRSGVTLCFQFVSAESVFINFGCVFSRSNTILAISQEWLSDWCETKRKCIGWILGTTCDLDLFTPLMTLTLYISRSNFEIIVSQELLVWLMWNEREASQWDTGLTVWLCPLITSITLTRSFKVRVRNSLISGMERPIDMDQK